MLKSKMASLTGGGSDKERECHYKKSRASTRVMAPLSSGGANEERDGATESNHLLPLN